GVLHVQHVHGPAAQLARERDGDAHERRVWQRQLHTEVRPAPLETLDRRALGHVERIAVALINAGQRLDQIGDVGLVAGEARADRVRVNGDVQTQSSKFKVQGSKFKIWLDIEP